VALEVGTEGKLGVVQAEVWNVQGIWQEITYIFVSFLTDVSSY
jgi:hypothetical protein